VRFGLVSDTHFQNWQAFGQCHENRISKRLLKQRDNFLQAVSVFKRERVDCIIHGGDWGHSVGTISNEVLNLSKDLLGSFETPILFVCGNHDTPIRTAPKDHHLLTNILEGFRATFPLDFPNAECLGKGKLCLINFQDEIDYEKVKGYDLVVVHKTPVGAQLGNYTFGEGTNWRRLASQNKFVAFGHIHQMQKLSENCFIIGAPMPFTFGDDGRRGVWTVDTDEGTCTFHKLDYPEFITVNSPEDIKDDGNYYKLFGTRLKIENENVISVVTPDTFKERIKAQDFHGIVHEWIELNGKDDTYFDLVKDILDEKMSFVKSFYKGRLAKVSIQDFLSIQSAEYKVPESGFTLITGESDGFSSNGSGKSSIIGESICWALFGETTKGLTGDDVIRNGQNDCSVELLLDAGGSNVIVKRSRKSGLSVMVIENGQAKLPTEGMLQKQAQELLEGILGFDKSVFLSSVYFSQENLLMMAKMSDTEKTSMITDLLGFDQYDDLQELVLQKTTKISGDILKDERAKTESEKDLAVARAVLDGVLRAIEEKAHKVKECLAAIDTHKDGIAELKSNGVVKLSFEKVDYDSKIRETEEAKETIHKKLEAIRETVDLVHKEQGDCSAKMVVLKVELDSLKASRKKIESEINVLRGAQVGVRCDKCGSTVSEDSVDSFINDKESDLVQIDADRTVIEAELKGKEAALKDVMLRLVQLDAKEDGFKAQESEIGPELSRLNRLKTEQLSKQHELEMAQERMRGEIERHKSFIDEYSVRADGIRKEKHGLTVDRDDKEEAIKILEEVMGRFSTRIRQSEEKIEKLSFWKTAFSPKGIRSVLLDRFCNDINATINGYLSTVSGGTMSIMMTPTKTTKAGEERNKIGMLIRLNGNETKYEALSGGEKRRVDVSLCFGLNKFVSEKYQVPSGILGIVILDEVFSFLDRSGEESVADLLYSEGKSRNVFVIDHALNLSSYADQVWVVKKEHGISTLNVRRDS